MNLMHCPLCLGLAMLSALRAMAHLGLTAALLATPRPEFTRPEFSGLDLCRGAGEAT
jgi:hypothetical protein